MLAAMAATRKVLSLFGIRLTPRTLVDALIRLSAGGDRFGLRRGGLSFSALTSRYPHGVRAGRQLAAGRAAHRRRLPRPAGAAAAPEIAGEVAALTGAPRPDGYPLRVIGMRELRSENSWMHNAPLLMRGERLQRALMHADDAARARHRLGRHGPGQLAARADRAAGRADPRHHGRGRRDPARLGTSRHRQPGGWPTGPAAPTSTS